MKIERFNTVVEIETSVNGSPPDKQDTGLFTTDGFTEWIRVNNGRWVRQDLLMDTSSLIEALSTSNEKLFRWALMPYQDVTF